MCPGSACKYTCCFIFNALSQGYAYNTQRTMMTSSDGNVSHVIGPLWGETIGHRRSPLTKASDTGLWDFLWSALEQPFEQIIETPVILDAIVLIMGFLQCREIVVHHAGYELTIFHAIETFPKGQLISFVLQKDAGKSHTSQNIHFICKC